MPIVLEEISDIQYITNKSGEKTAIIVPLEDKDELFRKLLTEFVESRNFKNGDSLISIEKSIHTLETLIQSIEDPAFLEKVNNEIENLIEEIDDKLDSIMIAERSNEETISHENLIEELKADGLI